MGLWLYLPFVGVYKSFEFGLTDSGITLSSVQENLVDIIWTGKDRPPQPSNPIFPHLMNYTGWSPP